MLYWKILLLTIISLNSNFTMAFFCEAYLKNTDPLLASRPEDSFSLKIIANEDDSTAWLIKHTGYSPFPLKKKQILENGIFSIALPVKGSTNKDSFRVVVDYKITIQKFDELTETKNAILDKIYILDYQGRKLKNQVEVLDRVLEFSPDALPGELLEVALENNKTIQLIPRISDKAINSYSDFMNLFLNLPSRNSTLRQTHNLANINSVSDFKNMALKLRVNNFWGFLKDRSGKQIGNIPVAIIIFAAGNKWAGYTIDKFRGRSSKDKEVSEEIVIELEVEGLDEKQKFLVIPTENSFKLIPQEISSFKEDLNPSIKDPITKTEIKYSKNSKSEVPELELD